MAEQDSSTVTLVVPETMTEPQNAPATAMDLETLDQLPNPDEALLNGDGGANPKRVREDSEVEDGGDALKKHQKVDKREEEETVEKVQALEGSEEGEKEKTVPVSLGPKSFGSSVEMFDYFFKLIQSWPPYLNLNKYEYMVLLDLLKKGHPEPAQKIGAGIHAFQVRNHPMWKNRCFFLIREDESVDDFSFRKCVDHILPLPEDMKVKPNNMPSGGGGHGGRGGGGGGGRRGGRGRGRGGKWRN